MFFCIGACHTGFLGWLCWICLGASVAFGWPGGGVFLELLIWPHTVERVTALYKGKYMPNLCLTYMTCNKTPYNMVCLWLLFNIGFSWVSF